MEQKLDQLHNRLCIGGCASMAWDAIVPADCETIEEAVGFFWNDGDALDDGNPRVEGWKLPTSFIKGYWYEDWSGHGGIWAVFHPLEDGRHLGWFVMTTNHEALLTVNGTLIERDSRDRVSRFWGNPVAATKLQRRAMNAFRSEEWELFVQLSKALDDLK